MLKQLPLPGHLASSRWELKIYDNERLEPPHATVIRGYQGWRWNLRSRQFMNTDPDPRDVPRELRDLLIDRHAELVRLWGRTHPANPVGTTEEEKMTLLDLPGDPPRAEDGEERYPRLTIVDRGLISLRISDRSGLWIATSAQFTERFGPTDRLGRDRLLVMDELDPSLHEYLASLFADVISGPSPSFLPINEIRDALLAPHFADLAVGVLVSEPRKAIVIVRADLERMVVPWAWFRPSGDGTLPHFGDVEVIDSGLAIRLGSYEASMDAILYEFDRDYRARDRQRQVATDVSFGASLRRLRIQRGVSRDGFPGISGKEIGRIERGDVVRPHGATIRSIADTLGVEPAEIETY